MKTNILVMMGLISMAVSTASSKEFESSQYEKITQLSGVPWGIETTSDDQLLITLRDGRVVMLNSDTGQVKPINGLPTIYSGGQGGLMDIVKSPQKPNEYFFTYAKPGADGDGGAPTLAKATLDQHSLTDWQDIFTSNVMVTTGRHFGSRLVIQDDFIFMTIGDAGERENGQDTTTHAGTIIRLNLDGSIPDSNPFIANKKFQPEIYSYGHRNPQGIAYHPRTQQLWAIEHGPRGGDELNLIEKGQNYGWPITSHGKEYWGPITVGEATEKEGIAAPKKVYIPSIAPGSLYIYPSQTFPRLEGKLLIGALKLTHINLLDVNQAGQVLEERRYYETLNERIRDITSDSKGAVWFSTDSGGIYTITRSNNVTQTE
ncbi:PQQ-dependent sugar dehydrogenase [Vibrio methylphosphonaticus]|uniref:PQQ-dependent sugar dehydrogenase n=1 Tax=Vibrio methylphosphonaticus TaxID=2946866 RepID=UPI002029E8B9|nr:PQQ-dependent sugar dehydrogenase [Vibrio methylphosphonaticus]MCL9774558.1 PQQ-dependent sugar dehydrogenase [Vibrio methylphosphonaticus]